MANQVILSVEINSALRVRLTAIDTITVAEVSEYLNDKYCKGAKQKVLVEDFATLDSEKTIDRFVGKELKFVDPEGMLGFKRVITKLKPGIKSILNHVANSAYAEFLLLLAAAFVSFADPQKTKSQGLFGVLAIMLPFYTLARTLAGTGMVDGVGDGSHWGYFFRFCRLCTGSLAILAAGLMYGLIEPKAKLGAIIVTPILVVVAVLEYICHMIMLHTKPEFTKTQNVALPEGV